MTPYLSPEILAELRTIKWLLVAVLLVGAFFVYLAIRAGARFVAGMGNLKENLEYQRFQRDAEGMLQRGAYEMVIGEVNRRLESYPSDTYAHYYLAQALFHTNKSHEARRAFEKVAELTPTWQASVDVWIQRLEERLRDAAPKVVK
ncbi:MAG: hypothetical protein B7X93_04975 [Hydrogenophilales bacterium 17-61-9]|nr:MAG: hypothetical protein B7X93_04975 [Hydrogenophilales bacterium 17-61-9]